MYYKGDTDIYEMIDTPTSLGRLGFVLLMVFLTSSPFLLFDKKKQADVNSHGIEYASVKECKENLADLERERGGHWAGMTRTSREFH